MSEAKQPLQGGPATINGAKSKGSAKVPFLTRLRNRYPFLKTRKGIITVCIAVTLVLLCGLAGLAALRRGGGAGADGSDGGPGSAFVVHEDTFFYGQSEPVYPSPNMTGVGPWAVAFEKARAMVANMTLEEKISLTAGVASNTSCAGNIPPIRRLGFPGLCLTDAGNGVRATDFVNAWPSGIHVAASWNRELALRRAINMGGEFRAKGVNVALGPVVGPAGRTLMGGRNWEGFSVDPYLSGALVFETVTGIQQVGVITSTKHYIANEQETHRNPEGGAESVSANIDDKTMHELYLWPFQDAVHAGTGNIMCSYNRINNSYGCANSKTLNGLLKTELGFQGFVVSDWGAQHAGVATALSGMDMAMPNDGGFWGPYLRMAVNNGSVPEHRVDDMAIRIIASWYRMGQDQGFPIPGVGMPADLNKPHTIVDARNATSKPILFDGAVEGHVLVKNFNNTALPFKTPPQLMSIFGYSAKAPDHNAYAGSNSPWVLGGESGNGPEIFSGTTWTTGSATARNGTIIVGGGSGANAPARISSPFEALSQQAYEDGTSLFWDFHSTQPFVEPASDVCMVIVNAWAAESYDRPGLRDDLTDGLIKHVADRCNNTMVVIHNAGPRLVDQWIDHANVTAVILAHLPGQDSGRALVSILYGRSNPSGRLPYTIARNESDYAPGTVTPDVSDNTMFRLFPQSNFSEGTVLDYRHFDARNITPRFEFGFGLSYTTFEYSALAINGPLPGVNIGPYPTGDIREGGPQDLWDVVATVSATVTNTGTVAGQDVAQLYLGIPGAAAPRQLRGFAKPNLNASQAVTVSFDLTRRDLSVWDVVAQKWLLQKGSYGVFVGRSSRDLKLNGTLVI